MKIDNSNKIVSIQLKKGIITEISKDIYLKNIIHYCDNYHKIDFIGVNNIGIENNKIFFVSGYTPEKGCFIEKIK